MEFSLTVQQLYERVLQDPQVELHLQRLEEYHHESYEHLLRVGRLTIYLGDKTGLASADILKAGYAGILHDVGKIGIPHCVLTKPEKLTPDERRIMRSHARLGFLHLQDLEPPEIARIVVAHHEFQPEGYPRATSRRSYERRHLETQAAIEQRTRRDRRQQERREDNGKISTLAQLVAAADVYDALSSQRGYKTALSPDAVREIMLTDYRGPAVYIDFLFS